MGDYFKQSGKGKSFFYNCQGLKIELNANPDQKSKIISLPFFGYDIIVKKNESLSYLLRQR